MQVKYPLITGIVLLSLADGGLRAADPSPVMSNGQVRSQTQGQGQGQELPPRHARYFMTNPPGSAFYPQYASGPYPPNMPITGTPAFQWGYFGARSKPNHYGHSGFHHDVTDWFLPRR